MDGSLDCMLLRRNREFLFQNLHTPLHLWKRGIDADVTDSGGAGCGCEARGCAVTKSYSRHSQVRTCEAHAVIPVEQTRPRAELRALRELERHLGRRLAFFAVQVVRMVVPGVVAWRPLIRHAARRRAVDAEGERAVAVVHDDLDHRAVRLPPQVSTLP